MRWICTHEKKLFKTEQVDCNDDIILSFQILAVYFYDSSFVSDTKLLKDLETIDDDLDREGVILVRLAVTGTGMESAEAHLAQKFGVDIVPSLVLFKYGRPHRFEGEITDEKDAIAWLRSKLASWKNGSIEHAYIHSLYHWCFELFSL